MREQAQSSTISVIVCTRNRADSLAITLNALAGADRNGISAEIVAVDNGSHDHTRRVVDSFAGRLPLRYLYEPELGVFGKSHALNRALSTGGLGDIVAVLDDDMSPHEDWFQCLASVCRLWPLMDLFSGRTYPIFPEGELPKWARDRALQSILFSAQDHYLTEAELEPGRWFAGGHFWFRKEVLTRGLRFNDIWLTEPDFQLQLAERGHRGVFCKTVAAGHRIQPELLKKATALYRARMMGPCAAAVRLIPYRQGVKQARLLRSHPLLGRAFCLASHMHWRALSYGAFLYPSEASRFARRLVALERMSTYLELFRLANRLEDYCPRSFRRLEAAAANRSSQGENVESVAGRGRVDVGGN